MIAEIISVGTELLLGQIVDTNAAYIARILPGLGVGLYRKSTVGDNRARLAAVVREALSRSDLVITTGGLGPTEDDLTREGVSDAMGIGLVLDQDIASAIRARFAARGIDMPESNSKQAMVPVAGRTIPNPHGTAPGLIFEGHGKTVICLPGVPREMRHMMNDAVVAHIRHMLASGTDEPQVIRSRVLRTVGIGESLLEETILDLLHEKDNPTVATYADEGECQVRITARADTPEQASLAIARVEEEIRSRLGRKVYGVDGDTIESVTGSLLLEARLTVSCAESCTGGLISHRLTSVPGSSAYFKCGIVAYHNDAKVDMVGVRAETIARHGAVSEETALEMAEGIRASSGTDIGISVTGIAGPGGGSLDKPVGLVYAAISHSRGGLCERLRFAGERDVINRRTSLAALVMLRDHLLDRLEWEGENCS